MNARDTLIQLYLSWKNDYISIITFADHHGLTADQALALINLAKSVFQSPHPDN